jgi:hypothetical protein
MTSKIKMILRNPVQKNSTVEVIIDVHDTVLSQDWITALTHLIQKQYKIEKNFCFMGFPDGARDLDFLCAELNQAVDTINQSDLDYIIHDQVTPEQLLEDKTILNHVHNHFEILQGTVNHLSDFYKQADYRTKYAIRELNTVCHELESLVLSKLRQRTAPEWVRLSQINTWLNAPRHSLQDQHRRPWSMDCYDRHLGEVYMHWAQIGKTLFEVYRDEGAPELTEAVCEAITHLEYYSGEFDIEWGNNIKYADHEWWRFEIDGFYDWLNANGLDHTDPKLSLGYLPIAQVDLRASFGSEDYQQIWPVLSDHLDVYKIEVNGHTATYDYCWTDSDYKQQQIAQLRPGYDHSSKDRV